VLSVLTASCHSRQLLVSHTTGAYAIGVSTDGGTANLPLRAVVQSRLEVSLLASTGGDRCHSMRWLMVLLYPSLYPKRG
jgi:hypothetical protein